MTTQEVYDLVLQEIGPSWRSEVVNGMALKDTILQPPREVDVIDAYGSGDQRSAWLVLAERSESPEGMAVIYDHGLQQFGLVEYDTNRCLHVIGLHSTLLDAARAM